MAAPGLVALAVLACARPVVPSEVDPLVRDDECRASGVEAGAGCALQALQRRASLPGAWLQPPGAADAPNSSDADGDEDEDVAVIDNLPAGWNDSDYGEEPARSSGKELRVAAAMLAGCRQHPGTQECLLFAECNGVQYCVLGGYMIVPGWFVAGTESINGGNAWRYNFLMAAARRRCGSPDCVLITNPVGYRTQEQLHIHYRHYNGGGAALKTRLEQSLCGTSRWRPFSQCGMGKARLYRGFPNVFSEVASAYGGGSLGHVGITVWFTTACGGGLKTMLLTTTDCSIEHSISDR